MDGLDASDEEGVIALVEASGSSGVGSNDGSKIEASCDGSNTVSLNECLDEFETDVTRSPLDPSAPGDLHDTTLSSDPDDMPTCESHPYPCVLLALQHACIASTGRPEPTAEGFMPPSEIKAGDSIRVTRKHAACVELY